MGDHSRYDKDDETRITRAQRTPGAVGRHRANAPAPVHGPFMPPLRPLPAMDATVWDMPAIRAPGKVAAEIQRHSHCHRNATTSAWTGLSKRATRRLAALALLAGLTLAGGLTAALGSASAQPARAHVVATGPATTREWQPARAWHSQVLTDAARAKAAASAQLAARNAVKPPPPPVPVPTSAPPPATISAGIGPGAHVTYSVSQIEALWRAEGGSAGEASTAACIAEHESGGRPWAFNGRDIGMWQIDPGNYSGPSSDLYNPVVNAQVAVRLQGADGWGPWTTAGSCGV